MTSVFFTRSKTCAAAFLGDSVVLLVSVGEMTTTTWAEAAAFLRLLILCCCRTEEGWSLPSPEGWKAERENEVDHWIKANLRPALDRPIPPEIRWGLLQRARAAGIVAASALHYRSPLPPVSLPRLLDGLLLHHAKKHPRQTPRQVLHRG